MMMQARAGRRAGRELATPARVERRHGWPVRRAGGVPTAEMWRMVADVARRSAMAGLFARSRKQSAGGMFIELVRRRWEGVLDSLVRFLMGQLHGMKSMKPNLPGCPATEGLQPSAQRRSPIHAIMYSGFDNGQYIAIACKIFLLSYYLIKTVAWSNI
jgi:hypothetical protein